MGDHCWIDAGMPAEQKQLIRASQIAAHKTPSAPKSPLSYCYVTDRERRGEWDCACAQNLNTCCFVSCGKLSTACVLIVVMAHWNRSNHFDTPCIQIAGVMLLALNIWHIFAFLISYIYISRHSNKQYKCFSFHTFLTALSTGSSFIHTCT